MKINFKKLLTAAASAVFAFSLMCTAAEAANIDFVVKNISFSGNEKLSNIQNVDVHAYDDPSTSWNYIKLYRSAEADNDDYMVIPHNGVSYVYFTADKGDTISVEFSSKSGTGTSYAAINNSSGTELARQSVKGGLTNSTHATLSYTVTSTGTYRVYSPSDGKDTWIYSIKVGGSGTSTVVDPYKAGDANYDGYITAADVAVLLRKASVSGYTMPLEKETSDYLKYTDMNNDNQITLMDAILLKRKL